ncbi:hypothetical protein MMC25_006782 [Agyrium rufum]|nr:hypothetical protein [Agyrium rufum]
MYPKSRSERESLREEIWPMIERAKTEGPLNGNIMKELVYFSNSEKLLSRADGTNSTIFTTPEDAVFRLIFAAAGQAAVRIAFEMHIFDIFDKEETRTAKQLAGETDVERALIVRIMRAVVALGVFDNTNVETYQDNVLSIQLRGPMVRTMLRGL